MRNGIFIYFKLYEARQKRNLSISQLSALSGISCAELRKIENNMINPMLEIVLKLGTALNIKFNRRVMDIDFLKKLRKKKKLSIRKLSKISLVSKAHISELERHNKRPSVEVFCRLLVALDVKIDNELFIKSPLITNQ